MNHGITEKETDRGFDFVYSVYILKELSLKVCKPYVLKIHSVLQEVEVGDRKLCIVIHFVVSWCLYHALIYWFRVEKEEV